MKPLVSILIPAFNAEKWIADTLRSAIAQTWQRKEIIVVDDGSTDKTLAIVRRFESDEVCVVTQKNQGAAAARNKAFSLCRGDYIQWLDADDILAVDKIARQMEVLSLHPSRRTILSSSWGQFIYRYDRAKFAPTALWCDLSPTEWLINKMAHNLYMPNATWLVSRELTQSVGPWDTNMFVDDDGEYFCRVLLLSDGIRFLPQARIYYRVSGPNTLSYIGRSNRKLEAQFRSIRLHIKYLLILENSYRSRAACTRFLQNWLIYFYPERLDIVEQAIQMASDLGGELEVPTLSWKYSWIAAVFGWELAKGVRLFLPRVRWSLRRSWDKALSQIEKLFKPQTLPTNGEVGVETDLITVVSAEQNIIGRRL